jgi:N-acetylneuraminate synthase
MEKVFIIAEVGINHNGDMAIARQLIDGAKLAGCNAVKFQKRTIDTVYTAAELDKPRESPWGTTNRQQKEGIEFSVEQYREISEYCDKSGIEWFVSCWDVESQQLMRQFNTKYNKVASAMLGHDDFLCEVASEKKHTFISTGMSTFAEIDKVVEVFKAADCPFELMHCNSTYPMPKEDANLQLITILRERYKCNVGYSGHESGRVVSFAAAVLGASSIERHITLDKAMYGSDQAASLEIDELIRLIRDIRLMETVMGNGEKTVLETEKPIREKLRYYEN